MHKPFYEQETSDAYGATTPEYDEIESLEAVGQDAFFGETEEMELAAQLLEITDENELDGFLGALITRAAGGARRLASSPELRGLLRQAAMRALPMIGGEAGNLIAPGVGGAVGSKLAVAAGNLFGLELEGLSPEDQEFEVARRFVRFAGAGARHAARFGGRGSPKLNARRALAVAARRYAPGLLRRRKPRLPVRARAGSFSPGFGAAAPIPLAVTCHCCGAPQTAAAPGDAGSGSDAATGDAATGDDDNRSPDHEPGNTTEPQTKTPKGTDMHDLDKTTMEINDEADSFEFHEAQDEYSGQGESTFNQDEVEELAANLLEITDEQELDQFLGKLLKKARSVVGGALKSPLLRPLGGFLKGAIKKALPMAGSALGNMLVPGIGGQIGSRLASGAGGLLGLEYEGVAPEDQELEVARRLVQTIGTAVQTAAQSPTAATDPQSVAKSAVVAAARAHLPGLLEGRSRSRSQSRSQGRSQRWQDRSQGDSDGDSDGDGARSGRWYRRNGKIIVVGV
jgi:hypothetical protein